MRRRRNPSRRLSTFICTLPVSRDHAAAAGECSCTGCVELSGTRTLRTNTQSPLPLVAVAVSTVVSQRARGVNVGVGKCVWYVAEEIERERETDAYASCVLLNARIENGRSLILNSFVC